MVKALQLDSTTKLSIAPRTGELDYASSERFWSQWAKGSSSLDGFKGLVDIEGEHWLWAMRPVTRTDGSGEVRGYLLFGKAITKDFVSQLSSELKYPMTLCDLQTPNPITVS